MNTEEFIKKATEKHSGEYTYGKSVYVNPETKVIITCKKHGDFEQTPFAHLSGQGCPKCAGRGLSQDEIIERFRSVHGDEYDYSKVVFTRMRDKVCIICPKHGEFWQTPDKHYKHAQGCPECAKSKRNADKKVTKEKFIERATKLFNGFYDYSKVEFNDSKKDYITIICPKHGEFKHKVHWHLAGHGCSQCAIEKSRITTDAFVARAMELHKEKYDYSKSNIVRTKDEISIVCPIHGEFKQTIESHLKGSGCPICGKVESAAEHELYEYICSLVGKDNVIHNDRTVLNGKEIDIYVPSLKIGIEYNGVVWHSEKFGKDRYYHLSKLEAANKAGVQLIQIFEDEYTTRKEMVLEKIRYLFKKCNDYEKINARSCFVSKISTKEAREFMEKNHIQGFGNSTVYLGLYQIMDIDKKRFNRRLVSVMSFRRLGKDKNEWELTRFATLSGTNVRGAGGKLMKHFIKKYDPSYIKSFADRRWTIDRDNNLYTRLGFVLEETLKPDYRYIVGSDPERIHKFNFRKNRLHEKYGLPLTMTESEMAENIGAYKIWDCGLFRYGWYKFGVLSCEMPKISLNLSTYF